MKRIYKSNRKSLVAKVLVFILLTSCLAGLSFTAFAGWVRGDNDSVSCLRISSKYHVNKVDWLVYPGTDKSKLKAASAKGTLANAHIPMPDEIKLKLDNFENEYDNQPLYYYINENFVGVSLGKDGDSYWGSIDLNTMQWVIGPKLGRLGSVVNYGNEIIYVIHDNDYYFMLYLFNQKGDVFNATTFYHYHEVVYSDVDNINDIDVGFVLFYDDGILVYLDEVGYGVMEFPDFSQTEPDLVATATPISSTVIVNGQKVEFDAYLINDSNYFKLRDLAYVLNGTEKQFAVNWLEEINSISLRSGRPYYPVGGEMTGKGSGTKEALLTSSSIFLDNEYIYPTVYSIEDNNYFKLRDIAKAFNIGLDWDEASQTITIDTSKGYVEPKK